MPQTTSCMGGAVLRLALGSLLAASLARSLFAAGPLGAAPARWRALGPEGGWALAVAFAPSDPLQVYAGLDGGGVFTSTDGGLTWHAPRGPIAGRPVFAVAVDPDAPGTAFAGTWDGVWITTTGGAEWHAAADHVGGALGGVLALAIDPVQRQTVYAATPSGVFLSGDAGEHWTAASQGLPTSGRLSGLALTGPSRLFVSWQLYNSTSELFASSDGGASWTQLGGSGVAQIDQMSSLLFDSASHTLYLTARPPHLQAGLRTLWRTSDGGVTWVQTDLPGTLGFNGVTLAVDPAGELYAGGLGVFASSDQGRVWNEVGPVAGGGGNRRAFAFVSALAADPSRPGRLLAGTLESGLFESTGGDWHAVNHGLTATVATGLVVASGPQRTVCSPRSSLAASSRAATPARIGRPATTASRPAASSPRSTCSRSRAIPGARRCTPACSAAWRAAATAARIGKSGRSTTASRQAFSGSTPRRRRSMPAEEPPRWRAACPASRT